MCIRDSRVVVPSSDGNEALHVATKYHLLRGDQGAPNGDAPEQYLLGGRLLLHRLFHREDVYKRQMEH